jgi:hypothetical protein
MELVELFMTGGPLFMFIISVIGGLMTVYAVKGIVMVFVKKNYKEASINYIILYGSLALIIGILAQAIGLFEAFGVIQEVGDIAPALIAGGLKVSMIAPLYGTIYFIIAFPLWFVLRETIKKHK